VSQGPLASRLLSLLRFEHRPPPSETANGTSGDLTNAFTNGDGMDLDGLPNGHIDIGGEDKPLPIAASVADLVGSKSSSSLGSKLEYAQADERIKMELRHLGFLGQDEAPDFDGHHDDDISERLRLLQAELRKVMITNGARKSRLLEIAKERLAYQEYNTIHEDLDSQVQQAYLKRTRTLGKTKKGGPGAGKPRPGGHVVSAGGTAGAVTGMSRARDIGDNARMLMDRRKRWEDCIGGVFEGMKHGVPGKETSLWDPRVMAAYEKAEMEGWEEEGE
jgi:transcriptional adapter 3